MQMIWSEEDVTLESLAGHILNSGLTCRIEHLDIALSTRDGIGYLLFLDADRQFVRFVTYLPVSKDADDEDLLRLMHRLNSSVFMASFWVDHDRDLVVTYLMSYSQGLIAGQFMKNLHRFAGMLDYVLKEKNAEGLITLGRNSGSIDLGGASASNDADDSDSTVHRLLN